MNSPRYYFYRENIDSVTAKQKDVGKHFIGCINSVYSHFVKCGSQQLIIYFYKFYLPEKLKGYLHNKLANRSFYDDLKDLNCKIRISDATIPFYVRIGLFFHRIISKIVSSVVGGNQ